MKQSIKYVILVIAIFSLMIIPFQDRLVAEEGFKVNTIAICRDVIDRTPVESAIEFGKEVGKLYCFTAISNPGAPAEITHVWSHNGEEMVKYKLSVGTSPNWRTWSSKMILPELTGAWNVIVLDPTGIEIGRVDFQIGLEEVAPEEVPEPEEEVEEEPAPPVEEAVPEVKPEDQPTSVEEVIMEAEPEEETIVPEEAPEEQSVPPEEEVAPEDTVEQG